MGFNFQKLPVNTLIGADWKTFHEVTAGRKIDKGYKTKYHLTKALCRILSLTNGIENRRYNKRLADKSIENAPVFILGHWRSGTTFVHNVLSQDKQFGYNTTYQTVFPHMMLFGQPVFKKMAAMAIPKKRPTDNMELKADQPQEEEFALVNMSPIRSTTFGSIHIIRKSIVKNISFSKMRREMKSRSSKKHSNVSSKSLYGIHEENVFSQKIPPIQDGLKRYSKCFPMPNSFT